MGGLEQLEFDECGPRTMAQDVTTVLVRGAIGSAARALETQRADPLAIDPYARFSAVPQVVNERRIGRQLPVDNRGLR